ncbi:UDP-2,4-diacetamido-2,4,6-trideoxy-beta-L-altropyranose hydrolase [Picosynechococcus sp. PCC 73109]|uniref:UDP-2,4-diacetamido-2,4, 6-trideoxy-beta-L-altropyranose hydrolase n=1 Tax=Picosynechococcus sp. PCC 73109 TaxID=374982 RepID=UPI000745945B|nr:UDP-2,4-diacetamido-2,4,6-trideoxy-beta-L-altropyranose hydrolase [Picosynechococcus sp. PCC 73109]AMA08229.1 UDP-2,4-diacetamido-2,4,6-trideoxy-beta-L-altropyranose hydrolase [Picosynechococcus sp. PCC 73109]
MVSKLSITNILIRADASSEIGTGHVMRCLALAQTLQASDFTVTFLMVEATSPLVERLTAENIQLTYGLSTPGSLEDAKQTVNLAQKLQADWGVVDGYQFGAEYQKILKEAGLKILFFDDYGHAQHYYADIVLNQNLGTNPDWYRQREAYTQLFLGCSYSLLRKEFWSWQGWQRAIAPVAKKILVTLGGGDPDNVTLKVIHALQQIKNTELDILVVVGGTNPHYVQLQGAIQTMTLNLRLVKNVTNMPELMAWADLVIAAGGSTNWELAFMGLPTVVITIADNQRDIARKLDQMGVVINLGWHLNVTEKVIAQTVSQLLNNPQQRHSMSQAARQLIDGQGSQRVVAKMQEFS